MCVAGCPCEWFVVVVVVPAREFPFGGHEMAS